MTNYVVEARTQAEVNQIISVLHSKGYPLDLATNRPNGTYSKLGAGKYFIFTAYKNYSWRPFDWDKLTAQPIALNDLYAAI